MNFQNNKSIYLQIADGLMDAIIEGEFPEGGRIPSVREFAAKVEVNANTVMRTYDWLQQQSIIFNKRGIGYFVETDAISVIREMRRKVFFKEEAPYFFNRMAGLGLSSSELAELYTQYLFSLNNVSSAD